MLHASMLNNKLIDMKYAVRGPIVQRAQELEAQGREIIYCNIGNPQALGQHPLTYIRQTLALIECPELLSNPKISTIIPDDIIAKAKEILQKHPHGTGAYSHSLGIEFIREAVAEFITRRDGIPSNRNHIFLTDGASKGVQNVILSLLRNANDGILIPIPQYPLYSATLTLYGGHQIPYYLDETHEWSLNEKNLETSMSEAKKEWYPSGSHRSYKPG
jgi:aspartate/methionine/tyrosine aminotransferase